MASFQNFQPAETPRVFCFMRTVSVDPAVAKPAGSASPVTGGNLPPQTIPAKAPADSLKK